MSTENYLIRQCSNHNCNFRYPAPKNSGIGVNCPKCKSETLIIHELNLNHEKIAESYPSYPVNNLEIVLDNIRSTFNVGAILRSSDGVGVKKIYLCGITPTPTNTKVHKTALGAEKTVNYEIHPNAVALVKTLKKKGYVIWALEKTSTAQSIFDFHISSSSQPTLLVVGNEIVGVDPDILSECDAHLNIPMAGLKNSLNVAIAFGIAVYSLTKNNFSSSNQVDYGK
jgi:tRNA G18 (ribose-2'-O)-methylase SpoU